MYASVMQSCLDAATFDPSSDPRAEPKSKATKEAQALAAEAVQIGLAERLATILSGRLGRQVEATEEALAIAIADKNRRDAAEQKSAMRRELGLNA